MNDHFKSFGEVDEKQERSLKITLVREWGISGNKQTPTQ